MSKKLKILILIPIILPVILLLQSFSSNKSEEKVIAKTVTVSKKNIERTIQQVGLLEAAEFTLGKVNTRGMIIKIAPQGSKVKKGDVLFQIDPTRALERIERYEADVDQESLKLENLKKKYDLEEYREDQKLRQAKEELTFAKLQYETELNYPTESETRLLEIEKELQELDLADRENEYNHKKELFKKGYMSEISLLPYQRKLETSKAKLNEIKLRIEVSNKGISKERKVELKTAVERAAAAVERGENNKKRRLLEIKNNIETTGKRLKRLEHSLSRYENEVANASTVAESDGILLIGSYRDWRAGGRLIQYGPGVEKHGDDVIAQVINPDKMKIKLTVNESDYHSIKVGMPVRVTCPAFPDKNFTGTLNKLGAIGLDRDRVDPMAKGTGYSEVVMFNAEIELDDTSVAFQPGMSALVDIIVDKNKERLVIPREGVKQQEDGSWMAYLNNNNVEEKVVIKGKPVNEHFFEIYEGLKEGDQVYVK